jgi:hypothetical protein
MAIDYKQLHDGLSDKSATYACPDCGDNEHLYDRADLRWNPIDQAWEIGDAEGNIDCTECDWTGHITECEVTQ